MASISSCTYCGRTSCQGNCAANAVTKTATSAMMMMHQCTVCGLVYDSVIGHLCTSVGPWNPTPQPKKLPQPQETLTQAITGWRRWSVLMFEDKLLSNNDTEWKPYEKLIASCPFKNRGPSVADPAGIQSCQGVHCYCGIYAYKIQAQAEHGENAPTDDLHIWGEVYLWGRVVEHEKGYRAQYAYPKSLVNTGGIAAKLADVYGCSLINVTPSPKPEIAQQLQSVQIAGSATQLPWSSSWGPNPV